MLEDLFSPPTWRPVNSVNIWNLLWLSSQLTLYTEPKNIQKSTFPDTLTPKMAKYYETSVYVTHRHNFEIQNVLVSKRRMLLSWKVVNRNKFGTSYA